MSPPLKFSILSELVSACSVLNTETTYKGESQNEDGDWVFISDAEPLAAHSIEHIYAAIDMLRDLRRDLSHIPIKLLQNPDANAYELVDGLIRKIEEKL